MSDGESRPAAVAQQQRSLAEPPAERRLRATLGAGVVAVLLLLGAFAYSLAQAQSQAREDVERRFRDVAQVSASLTNGIFDASRNGTVQQAMAQLGDERVDPARIEALARRGQSAYIEVYDAQGRRIGASSRAPRDGEPGPAVRTALRTGRAMLSDAVGRGPTAVAEWAIPFRSDAGPRVQVTGIRITVLGAFMASFLGGVPNFADSESEVIDSRGVVLGGSDLKLPLGRPLPDRDLVEAVRKETHGKYGDDRYFAAARIAGSTWRVVIATEQDDLYASVNTFSRRTVPWLLFGAFALTALVGLLLMRRSALAAAELERKQVSERHAVEINDNIIQGLALASYQLERGEKMAGSSQVGETLREAQRLVTELLGEEEVQPGQLRREAAAKTERPASEREKDA